MPITQQQFDEELQRSLIAAADEARKVGLERAKLYIRARGVGGAREVARLRAEDGAAGQAVLAGATELQARGTHFAGVAAELNAFNVASQWRADDTIVAGRIALGTAPAKGMKAVLLSDAGAVLAEGTVDASGVYAVQAPRAEFEKKLGTATSARLVVSDASGNVVAESTAEVRAGLQGISLVNLDLAATPERPSIPLERVGGLGEARISRLKKSNIRDVRALVGTSADSVAKALGISAEQARVILRKAASLLIEE